MWQCPWICLLYIPAEKVYDVAGILRQIQEPCHINLISLEQHLKVLIIIKCYKVSGSTFECLIPANTYSHIALILRCGRIPGFVSGKINMVVGLAQSELKILLSAEATTGGVLWKKVFSEISQNSQENTCAKVSILITLQASGLQVFWNRDSGIGVFLWILQNF